MIPWILCLLLSLAPPGRTPRESYEEGLHRYESIAEDIAETTQDRGEQALLISIAVHESGLRLDVDQGITKGSGRDVCILQIRTSRPLTRKECLREGLRLIRSSLATCKSNPKRDRLAAYASGRCDRGLKESRAMIDVARRML